MGKAKTSAASAPVQMYRAACPSGRTDKEISDLVENLKGDDAAICRAIDDWWNQAPKQEEDQGWVKSVKRGKKKEKAEVTTSGAVGASGGRGGRGGRGRGGPPSSTERRSGGQGVSGERRSGGRGGHEGRGVTIQPKPKTTLLGRGRGRGRGSAEVVSQKPTTRAWVTPSTEGPSGGWAAAVRDGGRQAATPAAASEDVERSSANANGSSIFASSSIAPAAHDGSSDGGGAWGPSKELAGRGGGGWGDKEVVTSAVPQEPGTTAASAGDTHDWGAGGVSLPPTSVWSKGSAPIINPKPMEKIMEKTAPPSPATTEPPVQTKPIPSSAPVKQELPPPSPQKTTQQSGPPKPSAPKQHPKKPAPSPLPVQVPAASDAEGLKMGKWDQGFDSVADQSLSFSFGSLGLGSGSQVAAQTGWSGEPTASGPGGSGVQGGTSTNFGGFSDSKQAGGPASAVPASTPSPVVKAQPTPDTSKSVVATVSAATSVAPAAPGSASGPPPGLPPLTGKVTQVHELEAELDRKKGQHHQAQAAAVGLAATAAKPAPSSTVDSTQPAARPQPPVTTAQAPPSSVSVASNTTSSSSGPPRGGRRGVGGTSHYNTGSTTGGGNFQTGGYVGPATPAGIAIQAQHVAPSGSSHHGMSAGQVPGGYAPPQGMHTQQGYTFPQQYGAQLYGYNPYFYHQGAYHAAYNQQGGDRGFAQAMPRGYPADYSTQASMMGYGMEYGQAAAAQGQYNEAQSQYSMAQSGQALQQPSGGVGGRRGVGGSALKGGGGQQQGGGNKGGGASTLPTPPPPSVLQSGVPREFGAGSSSTAGMPGSGYMYNVPPQGMGMAGADQQHYAGSPPPQWGGMMQQGHPTSGPTSMNPATHYPSSMGAHVNLGASQGQQYSTSGTPGGGGQQQYGNSGEGHSWTQS